MAAVVSPRFSTELESIVAFTKATREQMEFLCNLD